jgi:adenylate cyclase class 2
MRLEPRPADRSLKFEVESKFPTPNLNEVRQRLARMSAQALPPVLQIDQYYSHPARDFAATGEAFRLRRVGARNCLTYKGPQLAAATKTRREIELPIEAGEEGAGLCSALLAALGFRSLATVQKRRSQLSLSWEGHTVAAALDEVDGLGSFVELEILCDEPGLASAQQALARLAETLGLPAAEPRTYLEMLLEKGAVHRAG